MYACLTHYWHSNANIRSVTFGVCADRHTTTYAWHCIHSIQCAETYVWDVHVLGWCVQTDDYDDGGRNEDVDKTNRHRRRLCGRRMRACVCLECVCERVARSQAARRPHVSPPLLLPGTRAHTRAEHARTRKYYMFIVGQTCPRRRARICGNMVGHIKPQNTQHHAHTCHLPLAHRCP